MSLKKQKKAILDDHPLIIEGLNLFFSKSKNHKVIVGFNTSNELFEYKKINTIDVFLLDVFLSDDNGINICLKIKKTHSRITILGMSRQSESVSFYKL